VRKANKGPVEPENHRVCATRGRGGARESARINIPKDRMLWDTERRRARHAHARTTEIAGLASDSSSQTLSDASISAPISGAE
jgi:hypothetical protein